MLRESKGYGSDRTRGFVYNYAAWHPYALPILGTYDDYGRLEGWDDTDPALELLRAELQSTVIEYPMGENTHHDLPVSKEMFDKPDWLTQVQQRTSHGKGLTVKLMGHVHRMGAVFIRADVFDGLKEREFSSWRGDKINVATKAADLRKFRELSRQHKVAEQATWDSFGKKEEILAAGGTIGELFLEAHRLKDEIERLWLLPFKWYATLIRKQIDLDDEAVTLRTAEFLYVADYTERLRKLWHPTCGSGSQDESWDLHRDFSRIVYDCAVKSQRRHLDDDDGGNWSKEYHDSFWTQFPPPYTLEYSELTTTEDIIDCNGAQVPGIGDFGDYSKTTGKTYVGMFITLDDRKQQYTYFLRNEKTKEWLAVEHDQPPAAEVLSYMSPAPSPRRP